MTDALGFACFMGTIAGFTVCMCWAFGWGRWSK